MCVQAATPCIQAVCTLWRKTAAAGLSAAVYTQLADLESELNGLMTYDRHLKCPALLRQRLPAELEAAKRHSVAGARPHSTSGARPDKAHRGVARPGLV